MIYLKDDKGISLHILTKPHIKLVFVFNVLKQLGYYAGVCDFSNVPSF